MGPSEGAILGSIWGNPLQSVGLRNLLRCCVRMHEAIKLLFGVVTGEFGQAEEQCYMGVEVPDGDG